MKIYHSRDEIYFELLQSFILDLAVKFGAACSNCIPASSAGTGDLDSQRVGLDIINQNFHSNLDYIGRNIYWEDMMVSNNCTKIISNQPFLINTTKTSIHEIW